MKRATIRRRRPPLLRLKISDLENMLRDLEAMPADIERLSRESWEMKVKIAALQWDISTRKAELEYEVRTDKEKYKNEGERNAAIAILLQNDEGVERRRKEILDLESIKEITDKQIWKRKDEFTVLKYSLRASCAVIEGLCDPIVKEVLLGKQNADQF